MKPFRPMLPQLIGTGNGEKSMRQTAEDEAFKTLAKVSVFPYREMAFATSTEQLPLCFCHKPTKPSIKKMTALTMFTQTTAVVTLLRISKVKVDVRTGVTAGTANKAPEYVAKEYDRNEVSE